MKKEISYRALQLGSSLNKGSCGIIFFGGEPLKCKDTIYETIEMGHWMERRQAGRFHFKITTNGLLLDRDFIEFSIREDILIAMSFDGIRESHDRHRLLPDGSPTFDILVRKLKLLIEARPYSSVIIIVNPDTVHHLSESVEFLLDLSCKYLIISLNFEGDWKENDLDILKKQYKKLGKKYIKWTEQGRKFYLSPFEVKLSSHINGHCYKKERCELAQRQISVSPDGHLYPCVQFTKAGPDSRWCIGDVFNGINETARSSIYEESQALKETCESCAVNSRCNNTCGCLNWQTTRNINRVSPVLCRHERIILPIADHVGKTLYRKRNPLFLHKHYNAAYPVLSLLEDTIEDRPTDMTAGKVGKS